MPEDHKSTAISISIFRPTPRAVPVRENAARHAATQAASGTGTLTLAGADSDEIIDIQVQLPEQGYTKLMTLPVNCQQYRVL